MDRDFGSKTGGGAPMSDTQANVDRRERLRQLALETIDLAKVEFSFCPFLCFHFSQLLFQDPYFMKNHLGSYECKLCLTLHNNEGSYLAHTQGKRHQTNLARRAARDAKDAPATIQPYHALIFAICFISYSLLFMLDRMIDKSEPQHKSLRL